MARLLRGEIRWADLDPTRGSEQAGQRPVCLVCRGIRSVELFDLATAAFIALW